MDIKKIAIIMIGITMVCLIIGAIYLEKDAKDKVKVNYVVGIDDFSYDGEQLIVDNMVIEGAEDVIVSDNCVQFSVYEGGGANDLTPLLMIGAIGLGFFIILIILY